jgi:hypothetical protein
VKNIGDMVTEGILAIFGGEKPKNIESPEVLERDDLKTGIKS